MKNKNYKLGLAIFMALLFINCFSTSYLYKCDYALTKPEMTKEMIQKDFPTVQNPDSIMDLMSKNLVYHDSLISISFSVNSDNAQIGFVLINKADKAMKINWDDVSMVGITGKAHRVLHTGVRIIQKDAPQAPSVIPPNAKLDDAMTPVDLIYWSDGFGTLVPAGWKTAPLFTNYKKVDIENKEFSVYFPLEIGGEKKEYTFTFKISNVKESETSSQSKASRETSRQAKKSKLIEKENETVYITQSGNKYHREGCGSIAGNTVPISLKEAKQRGYTPCSICNP